jgi:hypothetical protein
MLANDTKLTQHLVNVRRTTVGYFHAITKVNEVLVRTFLLFCNQPVTVASMFKSRKLTGKSLTL